MFGEPIVYDELVTCRSELGDDHVEDGEEEEGVGGEEEEHGHNVDPFYVALLHERTSLDVNGLFENLRWFLDRYHLVYVCH